jgi:hypothetical protein
MGEDPVEEGAEVGGVVGGGVVVGGVVGGGVVVTTFRDCGVSEVDPPEADDEEAGT